MSETTEVLVQAGPVRLEAMLTVPEGARGVVLFAHGSGSSRFGERNRYVARTLIADGLATLLVDLLSAQEEIVDARTAALRFAIDLLGERVVGAVDWLAAHPATRGLRIGAFGASTGAAAALSAAARRPRAVAAVVSRGGRPDLAGPDLPRVRAPTLLVVGGADLQVLELNRRALALLTCPRRLAVVPGATHLFEEPGTLERVAELASGWFTQHLGGPARG